MDAAQPDFSIVMPTLNEAALVGSTTRLLKAAIDETGFRVEIVIADGGSTDGTLSACEPHVDRQVVEKTAERHGIASGRNAGSEVATGKILIHTDADVVFPNLPGLLRCIADTFNDDRVVAATTKIRVYPDEEIFSDRAAHFVFNMSIRLALEVGGLFGKGECQIVRASSFREIGGYRTDIKVAEDCNLFVRLSKVGEIKYLADQTVFHSPRRFRRYGYPRTFLLYFREFLFLALRNRSYLDRWEPVR